MSVVNLDILTYEITLDIDSSNNITLDIKDGFTVLENGTDKGNFRTIDFNDGTNTTATVTKSGNKAVVKYNNAYDGDVTGPSSSTDSHVVLFNGTTGKIIKSSSRVLPLETFAIALSDETTVLGAASTSTPLATFHMPYAFTVTRVFAGLTTAGTGASQCIVDIHEAGTTIMSTTKILFSASTKLSADGTLSDTSIAANALIECFLDQRDTDNVAAGLKVYIVGYQT